MFVEAVQFKPAASKYKIFIIDECHMLSTAAWNALLKPLEEPPPYVKFIFATTEGDKVLATIISRCQRFDLRRIQTNQIVDRLKYICGKESIHADEDALLAIARGAEGGMRDALSSLDQLIAFKGDTIAETDALSVFGLVSRSELEGLAGAILKGDAAAILRAVAEFDSAGKNMRRLAGELMVHFRNLVVWQALGAKAGDTLEITSDQRKTLEEQAKMCDSSRIFRIADKLAEMEDKLRYVLSVRTLIEMTLLRAGRIATVASIEELMKAVRTLKAGGGLPSAPSPAHGTPSVSGGERVAPAVPAQSPVSVAPAKSAAAVPKPPAPRPTLSAADRQAILDDPKLNDILKSVPGAKIVDISQK